MQQPLRNLRLFLLDLCFPNRCCCCHTLIPWNAFLCESCRMEIQAEQNSFCVGCGKPVENCLCGKSLSYDHAFVLTSYADAGKSGVLSMKSGRSFHFGWYCGQELGKRILQEEEFLRYDLITFVPMEKRKQRKRGCNPAQVLAKEVSRVTKIPLRGDLLYNRGTAKAQHTLSAAERKENVQQFAAYANDLTGYRIFICDDVLTTGSTMNRCAELLKSCGAAEVTALVATSTRMKERNHLK